MENRYAITELENLHQIRYQQKKPEIWQLVMLVVKIYSALHIVVALIYLKPAKSDALNLNYDKIFHILYEGDYFETQKTKNFRFSIRKEQ